MARGKPVPKRWQLFSLRRGLSPPGARVPSRLSAPPLTPGPPQGPPRSPQTRAGIPPGRAGLGWAASPRGAAVGAGGAGPGSARGKAPAAAPRESGAGCAPRGLFLSRMELATA